MSRSTEGLCTHGACSSFRSSEELRCQVFHRRPWLAETSQLGGGTLSLLCPPPTDGLQADKNRRPVVSACLAGVAQLLRLWSRKAHSLRLPADADASCGAETRLACRGIRRVDPRAKPGFCSSGCAFLRGTRTSPVSRSQDGPRPVIGRRSIAYSSGMLLHVGCSFTFSHAIPEGRATDEERRDSGGVDRDSSDRVGG